MTGQLFVVPAERPEDPYVRLVLELADGREVRFRDIRKFGRVGLYGRDPVTGELVAEVGGAAVFAALGPEPLDPAFSCASSGDDLRRRKGRLKPLLLDQSFLAGVGNIYADEALWTARLHPLRSAATLRRPTNGTSTTRSGRSSRRRSSGAAARSTTTPRPTATGRCRSACRSTSGPASRARAAAGRSSGSSSGRARRTSARGASGCGAGDRKGAAAILRTMTGGPRRRGRRWTELAGEGSLGLTPERRIARRPGPGPSGRSGRRRRGVPPRERRRARPSGIRRRPADEHPSADGRHPRGRHVRHPRRASTPRSRWATGSGWSGPTAPARRRSCGSPPAATSPIAARCTASAA